MATQASREKKINQARKRARAQREGPHQGPDKEKRQATLRNIPRAYKVGKGESFASIAGKLYAPAFGGDVQQAQRMFQELQRANPNIINLTPGVKIKIPKPQGTPLVRPPKKPKTPKQKQPQYYR